jgi:hypothetical protein
MDHGNGESVTKLLHEEEKISAQVKPDQGVLLREK